MVSVASMTCMVLAGMLAVLPPVAVAGVLLYKRKIQIRCVLAGALVFFVVQVVVRMNVLNLLALLPAWQGFAASHTVLYALLLSLTAGLVEEWGRYGGYRLLLKGRGGWWTGFGYGLGHGGFEALFLMGSATLNNLLLSFAVNTGILDKVAAGVPAATLSQIQATLVNTPPAMYLVGGLERVFALAAHLALSVLVLRMVERGRTAGVWLAVGLHTLLNFPPVLLAQAGHTLLSEGYIALCALTAVWYLWRSRKAQASPQ